MESGSFEEAEFKISDLRFERGKWAGGDGKDGNYGSDGRMGNLFGLIGRSGRMEGE